MKLKDVNYHLVKIFTMPEFTGMIFVQNEKGIIHGYTIKQFVSRVVCTILDSKL